MQDVEVTTSATSRDEAVRHSENSTKVKVDKVARKRTRVEVDLADVKPNPAAATPDSTTVGNNGEVALTSTKSQTIRSANECPYLATINRAALDADAEPICSVTLSTRNVYMCLVCGKYLQGRGPRTPAYVHSVDAGHHMFVHVRTTAVYCLPDGYQVKDVSLTDIVEALDPGVVKDEMMRVVRCADGMRRTRGVVTLDNLGHSDYASVVIQLLSATVPVRDALLSIQAPAVEPSDPRVALLPALGLLVRKLWAVSALRGHVAPHSVCRLLAQASGHRFVADKLGDPVALLAWLLATFTRGKKFRNFANVLRDTFQGRMLLTSVKDDDAMSDIGGGGGVTQEQTFWFLTLDLPPKPLFKDANSEVLVQQVRLQELLGKYDGVTRQHIAKTGEWRTYKLQRMPRWLLLNIGRFERTKFASEKNKCVVQTEVDGHIEVGGKKYVLVAAVLHEGESGGGRYWTVVRHGSEWYEIGDDGVKKTMAQLATLKHTYVLLYRQCDE